MGLGLVKKETTEFTLEELKAKFPRKKGNLNQELVDLINEANNNPEFNGNEFVETMVDYQSAMIECRSSIPDFVNAIKFCAYLETTGGSATEAYKRARAQDKFVQERLDAKSGSKEYRELSSAAARYRKNKLVQKILTQSEMPLYLMFQKQRYQAVGVLANEMESAPLPRDRIAAAEKLLTHVKPPENIQVELDIGVKESNAIQDLNMELARLASQQKTHLEAGTISLEGVGALKPKKDEEIIDAEVD